ncbi:MAG: lipocalin family protein [Bacteroides sp]|nr:lipocalin family protein [Bacteroides sp.]
MKKYCKYLYAIPMIAAALMAHSSCQSNNQIMVNTSTVKQLDIPRFMGKWYEIARYEHTFEKGMTYVTAEYSLLPDGKIRVINRGMKNGKPKEIIGKARQPDPIEYPSRLEVSFFLWFYADYYILELDKDYQHAIIGSNTDKYLWILSRSPEIPKDTLDKLLTNIRQRGYDLSKLVFVKQ